MEFIDILDMSIIMSTHHSQRRYDYNEILYMLTNITSTKHSHLVDLTAIDQMPDLSVLVDLIAIE